MTTADACEPAGLGGRGTISRQRGGLLAAAPQGRGALGVDARHLSVLVCDRRAPLSVVEHRDRRRDAGIYRARHRAPRRFFARHRNCRCRSTLRLPTAALALDTAESRDRRDRLLCCWCCSASSRCTGRAATGSPARCSAGCASTSTVRRGVMRFYALLWWALVVLTLGLAYPWAQASLQRFKMRHTSYGDLAGAFDGSGSALFVRGLPIWLPRRRADRRSPSSRSAARSIGTRSTHDGRRRKQPARFARG